VHEKLASAATSSLRRLPRRFNSDGVFRPYFDEASDGYDTVEWIAGRSVRWQCRHDRDLISADAVVMPLAPPAAPEGHRAVRVAAQHDVAQRADLRRLLPAADGGVGARHGPASWQVSTSWPAFAEQQDYYDALPLSTLPDRPG